MDKLCKSGCEQVARAIKKKIGGRIGRIEPNPELQPPGGESLRLQVDGRVPGWYYHRVVVKDGRVYDLLTGPEGQAIDVYKARFLDGEQPAAAVFDF